MSPRPHFSRFHARFATLRSALGISLACASWASNGWAQDTAAVLITGNPLGREVGTQASSVLTGDALLLRRAGSLGETLDGLPGLSASGFGPNASRPVIRGLDGDRVRLLTNGGALIDASNLSFDHAAAIDPLVSERIEVLRGPAALLYGGNATGGVVNSIDNRIPRQAAAGLSGRAEVRAGGAASERSGAAVLEGGAGLKFGNLAWHADAYGRQAQDLRVPGYVPVEDGEALPRSNRVRNSAARGEGGALGASWVGERGFMGASVETYRNRYGVTVEPDVTIRMQRERLALAGEWQALPGLASQLISSVSTQASHTRYQHQEVEGSGAVGTTFKSTGDEVRVELRHAPWAGVEGVWGLQTESLDFSALGAEAFVPDTRTRSQAVFVLEEWAVPGMPGLALTAGGRTERVRLASSGDAPNADEPRFGAASERRFNPTSLSLGARWAVGPAWQLSASLGSTQRAPAYYELYANGLHVATAAFERGDTSLGVERSRHAELGAAWQSGGNRLRANVYRTSFARFISLDATGQVISLPGEAGEPDREVPEYAFRAVRATLQGIEVEGRLRLAERLFGRAGSLDLTAALDRQRGQNLDSAEPLPRLAPQRLRLGLDAVVDGLRLGVVLRHAARQSRVPASDTATPSSTALDFAVSGRLGLGSAWARAGSEASWFARLTNAGNRLAFNASAIQTVRGLSPLAGRALSAGVQVRF